VIIAAKRAGSPDEEKDVVEHEGKSLRSPDHLSARRSFGRNRGCRSALGGNKFQEVSMPNDDSAAPKSYDRAREMTEKALDAYVEGDDKTGGKLVEQAKTVNEAAVRDVHQELEEDAASEHDPEKLIQSASKKNPD
jgi:hypothetical protein